MDGKKVQVFLSGDFHFQDDMLGHGGSASSYPSSADFVSLQHLRNHGPEKHSIESCKIPLRTVEWYHKYYNDNRADTRANGDLRENAKNHYSVIERMLFPIKDLKYVVPPVLHIMLGIVLRLFTLVERECQRLDGICTTVEEVNRKADLDHLWQTNSIAMEEKMEQGKQLCNQVCIYSHVSNSAPSPVYYSWEISPQNI